MDDIIKILLNLSEQLKEIKATVGLLRKTQLQQLAENWIDGQEVMFTLKVSKRTLQTLRDSGSLPFSRIKGKFYYKVSDIETMLQKNYSKSKLLRHE